MHCRNCENNSLAHDQPPQSPLISRGHITINSPLIISNQLCLERMTVFIRQRDPRSRSPRSVCVSALLRSSSSNLNSAVLCLRRQFIPGHQRLIKASFVNFLPCTVAAHLVDTVAPAGLLEPLWFAFYSPVSFSLIVMSFPVSLGLSLV